MLVYNFVEVSSLSSLIWSHYKDEYNVRTTKILEAVWNQTNATRSGASE